MTNWSEGLRDLCGECSIKHVNLEVEEENLGGVILQGIHNIFAGEGIGRTHSESGSVALDEVIVL